MSSNSSETQSRTIPQPIGDYEFPHRVKAGDSLSKIAVWYRKLGWPVNQWEPIWRLNESVYSNMRRRGNPSLIVTNDVLIIPRSPVGYDRAVNRLTKLKKDVAANAANAKADLKSIQKGADKFESNINLAGTVLTLSASLAIKGINLITLTNQAKSASGPMLEKIAYERSFAAFAFYTELIGGGAEVAASTVGADSAATAIKTAKVVTDLTVTGKKGAAELGARGVKAVVSESAGEILMHALGYINPGTLARRLVGLDAELKQQEAQAESMMQQLNRHLEHKISQLKEHKKIVYGKS
jgi:hypothetical protein